MADFTDTTLYTHDRLNNFVKDYKGYIQNLFQQSVAADGGEIYQYYRYENTPNAITNTDIGRIPANALMASSAWNLQSNYNSTNGWIMTLGTQYNQTIRPNQDATIQTYGANGGIVPGLQFNAITIPNSGYFSSPTAFLTNSANFIDLFTQECSGIVLANKQMASSMATYTDALNDPNGTIINTVINSAYNTYGVEWFGYFYPSTPGKYTFTINVDGPNNFFLLWIGDKAVCEYTGLNVDITNSNPIFTFTLTQNSYYPIRIQYFSQVGATASPTFSLQIQKMMSVAGQNTITVPMNTAECLFTINNGNYLPTLQYCAFVSQSPDYFKQGKFQCYVLDLTTDPSTLSNFYQIIQQNKNIMQNGSNNVSGGIKTFGQLPDNTYYTPVIGDIASLPEMFSVYRLTTDYRMGNSYQIDTRLNNLNLYPMRTINPSLLENASDYDQLSGYYPNYTNTQGQNATNDSGEACKNLCNSNPNCSFYYTYTSNGNSKCVVDSGGDPLQYNQIPPIGGSAVTIDQNSSNLFLRNKQLTDPGCGENPVVNIKTLENVAVYNNTTFPFSEYDWSGPPVTKINDVGVCGDHTYHQLNNQAADILYNNAFYKADGSWKPGPAENFQGQGPSSQGPSSQSQTKYTDAINDTADSIKASLANQQKYAQMMGQINQNYVNLSQTSIPTFLETRTQMENERNYDYNGNTLLYLRDKRIPTAKEQNISDINESYTTQNLVYMLGTITAATLLVLAILLARE